MVAVVVSLIDEKKREENPRTLRVEGM